MKNTSRIVTLASLLAATQLLSACAPLLIGGAAVGGALMYTDRRTSGAQVEDEAIEAKSYNRIRQAIGDRGHVNVTSYNRLALLTGEVPSESDRAAVANAVAGVENLRSVTNEIAVMPNSSLTSRSSDAIVTSKVKATLFDAKDVQGNAFKVVTERGTVYLMGVVTERELNRATELTRSISGVDKVVRVAEVVSEEQLKALQPAPTPAASAAR
ncbi:BON domain-containing protein [Ideonella sp. B508-1]|uniref:BON domain-containing protein n=1 Tax=Ideonella sp. B508-1 TaxID=137716 RepID=UPI0003469FA9|nr:BON domain-containing protein [Ideonella sp. B508-1]